MNTKNIPTPRTDAQYKEYARRDNDVKCVDIDFARKLEQELRQAREELANQRVRLQDYAMKIDVLQNENIRLKPFKEDAEYNAELLDKVDSALGFKDIGIFATKEGKSVQEAVMERIRDLIAAEGELGDTKSQLSQWQECAREMQQAIVQMSIAQHSETARQLRDKALALFTKLTSTTTNNDSPSAY